MNSKKNISFLPINDNIYRTKRLRGILNNLPYSFMMTLIHMTDYSISTLEDWYAVYIYRNFL